MSRRRVRVSSIVFDLMKARNAAEAAAAAGFDYRTIDPMVAHLHEAGLLDLQQPLAQAQPRRGVGLDVGDAVAALARDEVVGGGAGEDR